MFLASGPPYSQSQLTQGARPFLATTTGRYVFTWQMGAVCAQDYWGIWFLSPDPDRKYSFYGAHSSDSPLGGTKGVSFVAEGFWWVQVIADHSQYGNDSDPACTWSFSVAASD